MLSQVKRKQKLLFALTLTVFITGSILAFSIQAAYSTADYNSSRSNTSTSIAQIEEVLDELKAYAKILGDANMISSIEILSMDLQQVKQSLVEMDKFYSALETEILSMKQTAESTATEPKAESTATEPKAESTASELQKLQSENESLRSEKNSLATELQQLKQQLQSESESTTAESARYGEDEDGDDIPDWTKKNAGWWADGLISDDDYVIGLEWMINNGIIQLEAAGGSEDAYQK